MILSQPMSGLFRLPETHLFFFSYGFGAPQSATLSKYTQEKGLYLQNSASLA